MQSGVDKSTSKSVELNFFVKDYLHGEITDSVFVTKNETAVYILTPSNNNSAMELGDRPAPDSR